MDWKRVEVRLLARVPGEEGRMLWEVEVVEYEMVVGERGICPGRSPSRDLCGW